MGPGSSRGKQHRGSLILGVCQTKHPQRWRFGGLCTNSWAEKERNHLIPLSEGWRDWHLDSSCPSGQLGFCKIQVWHAPVKQFPLKADLKDRVLGVLKNAFFSPSLAEAQDTTERLHFHFSLSCIGEGNGNPLRCSCLENPRDRGAWWAAVYGVAQSRPRLKRLSSSSSSPSSENRCVFTS